MIPAFDLTRSIDIRVTRFAGEVAREEKRPEMMPFLLMARDHGVVTADLVAGELLGASEGRRPIARRLLEQLERSGALEAQGKGGWTLTEAGHEALEKKTVFIAERGSWEAWHACDPLLPHGLIQLKRANERSAFEESRSDMSKCKLASPHPTLEALKGNALGPIMGGERQRIDELPNKVELCKPTTGTLLWEVAKRRLTLTVDEKSFDLPAPTLSLKATFEALLKTAGLAKDWDAETEVLHRSFTDLPDASRRNMREDFTFPSPVRLHRYGDFDQTTVCGIDITARTRSDAEAWADWRLEDNIDEIACSRRYAEWREQASEPFAEFMPRDLPSRADLAARTRPTETGAPLSAVAWNLTAAEDWNL